MNYQELVSETGFLTSKGKELADQKVFQGAKELLDMMQTEIELRIMAGILSKHIGDLVANKIAEKSAAQKNPLFNMSDEEFELFLKAKYGENYPLMSLTKEELERCPALDDEKVRKAWADGLKAFQEAMKAYPNSPSIDHLRFIGGDK